MVRPVRGTNRLARQITRMQCVALRQINPEQEFSRALAQVELRGRIDARASRGARSLREIGQSEDLPPPGGLDSRIVAWQVRHSNRSKCALSSRDFLACMAMPQIGQWRIGGRKGGFKVQSGMRDAAGDHRRSRLAGI